MSVSTHYYVLSLGNQSSSLFEAFRDSLIDVKNQGFPFVSPLWTSNSDPPEKLQDVARKVDDCFDRYHTPEPLRLVVLGERPLLSAFLSVTAHTDALIGQIEGDHTTTTRRDLGQIVWPVVREAMSGVVEEAMHDLDRTGSSRSIASGLEAVTRQMDFDTCALLLVEEDYHVRGSIGGPGPRPVISPDVDVRNATDDVVDAVIDRVLEHGGRVVFAPSGSLQERDRIVLVPQAVSVG